MNGEWSQRPSLHLVPIFKDEPKRNRACKAYKNITKEENKRLSLKSQRDNKLLKIIYKRYFTGFQVLDSLTGEKYEIKALQLFRMMEKGRWILKLFL